MFISLREILLEARVAYRNNFRSLSLYLIFAALAFFGMWLIASIPLAFADSNIFLFLLSLGLFFVAFFIYFKIMIGFEMQLRRALHKQKLLTLKETIAEAKPFTWNAMGASMLAHFISFFPLFVGVMGLVIQNKNTVVQWLITTSQFPEAITMPQIEIHGVSGYFFLLLAIYGLFHSLYFSILLSMSYYSVIFDKKDVRGALEKSVSLVQGQWLAVFWRVVATGAILVLLYGILTLFSYGLQKQFGPQFGQITDMIISIFMNFFAAIPLVYLPAMIIFDELMKKSEKK
jgi:hypothetical protein